MERNRRLLLLVTLVVILSSSSSSAAVEIESKGLGQWHILTKQNFSSQIRLHPHILLFVSVPWCGEARSLMKQVTELVTCRQEEFGGLKLMYINRNTEKMLADGIGATGSIEGVTVLYYHHSLSYKYQGKKPDAKKILSSILPYMSVLAGEEIPLIKTLNSQEDLKTFFKSSDKAVLLLDTCGWTPKLLPIKMANATHQYGFGKELGFNGGNDGIPATRRMENPKVPVEEGANLKCGIENGFSRIPWLGDFSSVNDSAAFQETDTWDIENINSSVGLSCTFEKLQQFDYFLSSFMTVAREFFLPTQRHTFGMVSDKSLLSSLGVEDSGSWSVMVHYSGCPSCSKILKEGDDLKSFLQMDKSIVRELEDDGQDVDPSIPANKPSVLLFVDRSSDLSESRQKSKEALDAFRELALHYEISDSMGWQKNDKYERYSIQAFQEYRDISGHPRLKLSPKAQKIKLKDQMSIMIVNDGKHAILDNIASDLQGSSLHEILTYLLQKKEAAKLSSVAKEAGFQLLSDDFDIRIADALPSEAEVESKRVSLTPSKEGLVGTSADLDKIAASNNDGRSQHSDVRSSQSEDEKTTFIKSGKHLVSLKPDQLVLDHGLPIAEDIKEAEQKGSSQVDKLGEEQLHFRSFNGSFFFCDGSYRLLRALTGETRIPSLVIIDPILRQHYVFPERTIFSYSSLEDFLNGFLNGSLVPYQLSEAEPESPREGTHPPFVNMDFHEADSIPRVTAHTFSEQVLGFNKSDDNDNAANAWNEDVLVLFSNNWCGFCQRMELVVREVHRAIKGYMNMLKTRLGNRETIFSGDNLKNAIPKLPKFFLMDCTLNDCSFILKSMDQREVYPALLLFPAERKTTVSYEGGMAVSDIIKFIADHGSNSRHLTSENGILWTVAKKRVRNQNLSKDTSPTTTHEDAPVAKEKSQEVLLKNLSPKRTAEHSQIKSHASKGLPETGPNVVVGSILTATEKLSVQPFDKSMILIVKADQNTGFQGLIYNKPMTWDSLNELEGSELLKGAPLSFGGPLIKRGMPLVALTRKVVKGQYLEVVSGIYFLDQLATLHEIEQLKSGNQSLSDYWFFLGFSSWGWDQLFDEIAEGAWNLSENKGHLHWPLS